MKKEKFFKKIKNFFSQNKLTLVFLAFLGFSFPLIVLGIFYYDTGYYTNLCGSGTNGDFYSCPANCDPSSGDCSGDFVVKYICDGKLTECNSNESIWSTYQKVNSPYPGCGKTVQINVFSKNCREGGGWNCNYIPCGQPGSDCLGYMVWYSGDCQLVSERVVGRVAKEGENCQFFSGWQITSNDWKIGSWDYNYQPGCGQAPYFYIGRWNTGQRVTITLSPPAGFYCTRWTFYSQPPGGADEISGTGCSATITIGSGNYSPDWQNHLWFYVDQCQNECFSSGQEEMRCSGNYVQKRTCGNFDSDPCLEWSNWSNVEYCSNYCLNGKCILPPGVITKGVVVTY
jgi:hypothetical protein